jgi:uncharacterized protein YijF (DUF1287 family)
MNLAMTASMVLLLSAAAPQAPSFADRLVDAAVAQTGSRVTYDGSYRRIPYPGGDVPASIGVCTDVVITGQKSGTGTPLVVHNIGRGPEVDDILFAYPITGHYRYEAR